MTDLDIAIWNRMNEIVQTENRPFSHIDFVPHFSVFRQNWSISSGTFRNKVSSLLRQGMIYVVYYSPQAFYTLKGIPFHKPIITTADHTRVIDPLLSLLQQQIEGEHQPQYSDRSRIANHPIYRIIQNLPFDRNTLHDIRLRTSVHGLWNILSINSNNYERFNPISKDILFKTFRIDELIIRVTIHRTNTISIIIGCSSSPVAVDTDGILRLTNALRTVRESLHKAIIDSGQALQNSKLVVPCVMDWIVAMWHFGADASITYKGEKFFASWKVGYNALLAVYSKEWKRKGKGTEKRIRIELQELPKKSLLEALEDKRNTIEKLKER
jgi:hypothetical protein